MIHVILSMLPDHLKLILFFFFKICLFLAVLAFLVAGSRGGYSSLRCAGFSLLLQGTGPGDRASAAAASGLSSCGPPALEGSLSNCGSWAQSLWGICGLPKVGIEPMSPASAGGFSTTVPPGKPKRIYFKM